jgi:LysR family transcriptional regulator, cyn operon transcriptional activator
MHSMKLAHLRMFVAAVDNGGIAHAAARLNLTQSAASRQIMSLEAELGIRLFDRVGRRIRLTAEGEDLLRRCRRVLAELEAIDERALSLKSGQVAGALRIGATPQIIENLLADFLMQYRRENPGVDVHIVEEGGARLPHRLGRGDVHFAIMPEGHWEFEGQVLYPMHVLAVLSRTHHLSKRALIEVGDLADEPLLLLRRSFASRDWFDAACSVARIRPRIFLESAAPQALIALARTGYGIAVVPSVVQIPPDPVAIAAVVLDGVPLGRWAVLAWNPQRFLAPFAMRLAEQLVSTSQRDYPGREFVRWAPPLPQLRQSAS